MKKLGLMLSLSALCLSTVSCSPKINMSIFTAGYDYGHHLAREDPITGEKVPIAALLFDNGILGFSVEEPKQQLIAGDKLFLRYTGELRSQATYPSTHRIEKGEVIEAEYRYTTTLKLLPECWKKDDSGQIVGFTCYSCTVEYVITDEEMNFVPLKNYTGTDLFASFGTPVEDDGCLPELRPLAALYAFDPRPNQNIPRQ